jgi:3-hydroxybutyryl-CoA dehydratase
MQSSDDEQLYLEDFQPGQLYSGQVRKLGEEEFALFAGLTGDSHPIHYDKAYAQKTRFGERVAHGLLLMAVTALGATPLSLRLEKSMVAFVEQDGKFEKPVLIGDSVSTEFLVEEVRPTRSGLQGFVRFAVTMKNGKGERVLSAHHTYLIKRRTA